VEQSVALMGRNRIGPPGSVGHPTADAPGGRPDRPPAALQTTTTYDRRQRAKQYWSIRRASNGSQLTVHRKRWPTAVANRFTRDSYGSWTPPI